MKKELGITDRIIGNSVYKPVSESIDEIIEKHVAQLKSDININITKIDRSIPYLYWISKQHKNPYKFRFIAGALHCTTKLLSVKLTLALKLIKNHFQNYCNKIAEISGFTLYWSINNSSECIQKLKDVNATSVYTFDFSTLYTNLPLEDIHEKLSELICRMFRNANARYLLVNTYTKKTVWSHSDKNGYFSFSLQHLLDTLEFILFNIYPVWSTFVFTK